MQNLFLTDLQLFADESAPAASETASGAEAADAGQHSGGPESAPTQTEEPAPARRSWAEVRADYKAEFDAEVQLIVQKRLRGAQEKLRSYAAREEAQRLRAALRRERAAEHFRELSRQAGELSGKMPGFDLMSELENDAFAEITRPGSSVTLEQAFYALHPEIRERETEEAARRAAEAVSAAVRSGAARPRENGAQSASLGTLSYRSMSKGQREELKRRIYAAGAMGDHLPAGR
jgi:hypothetical protein